jgi:hypothetical protein
MVHPDPQSCAFLPANIQESEKWFFYIPGGIIPGVDTYLLNRGGGDVGYLGIEMHICRNWLLIALLPQAIPDIFKVPGFRKIPYRQPCKVPPGIKDADALLYAGICVCG